MVCVMVFKSGDLVPYAPPSTAADVLRRYRDRGLPSPLTAEVLERAGVPETLTQRTLQSFKLLGLVDAEGKPDDNFMAANRAPETEYKTMLGELILEAYSEVVTFADPATDSYDRVRDAFRAFNPQGQQDRMVALFLGLLEYVGMDTSAATASRKRADGATAKQNGPKRPSTTSSSTGSAKRQRSGGQGDAERFLDNDLPPGLVGLLRQIPKDGCSWTTDSRDAFVAAFTAVLNFTVPVDDAAAVVSEVAGGEPGDP